MADLVPPSYEESNQAEAPAYASTSDISARWHIVNTPAKGVFGPRGISLFSDPSAITCAASLDSQASKARGYNLIFTDNISLEVYEAPPAIGPSSSDKKWKTPLLANIHFASGNPTKANVSFVGREQATLTIDAHDLRIKIPYLEKPDPNNYRLVTMHHAMRTDGTISICWSAEPNMDVSRTPAPGTVTSLSNETTAKSSRWKTQFKEALKFEESEKNKAAAAAQVQQQKESLSCNFNLRDVPGNIFAKFTNELLTEGPSMSGKIPNVQSQMKHYRAWGYLDIHDPNLARSRTAFADFEKFSESEIELLVLLTLVMTLEVNLKINGGREGSSFNASALAAAPGPTTFLDQMARGLGNFGIVT